MEGPPFVSVAVATRNRAALLGGCLAGVLRQDYPQDRYEVIVVDDGSTDDTTRVVQSFGSVRPRVRYFYRNHEGLNAARNVALRVSDGDPVCFVDDDEEVPPSWLPAIVEGALAQPHADCLGGSILLRCEGRPPRMCGREPLGESELDHGDHVCEVDHVWGGNMAVRRQALKRVGLFREDLRGGGDETEWQDRVRAAGRSVVYLPEAWLVHRRTQDDLRLRRLVLRRLLRGKSQALNASRIGKPPEVRRLVRSLRIALAHAVEQRCSVGLIEAAQHAGRLLGMAEAAISEPARRRSGRQSVLR